MKKNVLSILMIALALLLSGCSNPSVSTRYTVTYRTDHGTAPQPITVEEDSVLTTDQLK